MKRVWLREVMLVAVAGKPRYGDAAAMKAAGAGPTTTLSVSGKRRALAIPDPDDNSKAFEWKDIVSRFDVVRKNPAAAMKKAEQRSMNFGGPRTAHNAPLELELDMPTGDTAMAFGGPPPNPAETPA